MKMEWRYEEGKVYIQNGGDAKEFRILAGKSSEVDEYVATVQRSREIHTGLIEAEANFRAGTAKYKNGVENYQDLLAQIDLSRRIAQAAAMEIDAFFDPPKLTECFVDDPDALKRFVIEMLPRMSKSVEVGKK